MIFMKKWHVRKSFKKRGVNVVTIVWGGFMTTIFHKIQKFITVSGSDLTIIPINVALRTFCAQISEYRFNRHFLRNFGFLRTFTYEVIY